MQDSTSTNLADIWQNALTYLEKNFTGQIYDTWIKSTIPISVTDTTIELGAPKKFVKEWFENRYLSTFKEALKFATNKDFEIIFTNIDPDEKSVSYDTETQAGYLKFLENIDDFMVDKKTNDETLSEPQNILKGYAAENNKNYTLNIQNIKENDNTSYPLNPKYIFSTFVVGNSNRLAHAASLAIAEAPAQIYNPFFIYGDVGLGKTHLMHAIGHSIKENYPKMRVVYISSEKFTNELINSIVNGNPESFRQRYRYVDVLLVDDIQFLSKKERTQEEFFHTFNILHGNNKQIIISSDRPPRDIETLESRLRSRFESGLITDVSQPDLETRIAVLRKKAMLQNLNIPNEVIVYIANRIENNIRELEGAFIRVVAYASLSKRQIDVVLAAEALQNIFPNSNIKQITIENIKEVVASYFKIKLEDLSAKNRTRNIAYPRQIAMYLCRELTPLSLPKIGEAFGGRDHTTVIHSHDKIDREKNSDSKLNATLKELVKKIEN